MNRGGTSRPFRRFIRQPDAANTLPKGPIGYGLHIYPTRGLLPRYFV